MGIGGLDGRENLAPTKVGTGKSLIQKGKIYLVSTLYSVVALQGTRKQMVGIFAFFTSCFIIYEII